MPTNVQAQESDIFGLERYYMDKNNAKSTDITANVYKSNKEDNGQPEYEECLSCQ